MLRTLALPMTFAATALASLATGAAGPVMWAAILGVAMAWGCSAVLDQQRLARCRQRDAALNAALTRQQSLVRDVQQAMVAETGAVRREVLRTRTLVSDAAQQLSQSFTAVSRYSLEQELFVRGVVDRRCNPDNPQGLRQSLDDAMLRVTAAREKIGAAAAEAVRSLQFEDIATQALHAAEAHLQRLEQLETEASRLQELFAAAPASDAPTQQALDQAAERLRGLCGSLGQEPYKPVSQMSLRPGTVELF